MTSNPTRAKQTGIRLVATKPMTYATRRLMAEESFHAPEAHGRVLVAIGKARYPTERDAADIPAMPEALRGALASATRPIEPVPPPPAALAGALGTSAPAAGADLTELRREYTEVTGRRFFSGWDAAELRRRIAAAKQSQA